MKRHLPALALPMKAIERTNNSFHALTMGSMARWYCTEHTRGNVLASVTKCLYLSLEEGNIFWLVGQEGSLHSRCIQIEGCLPALDAGVSFTLSQDHILFSDGTNVDLTGCSTWQAALLDEKSLQPASQIYPRAEIVFQILSGFSPRGFGIIIPSLLHEDHISLSGSGFQLKDSILLLAAPHILEIARGSRCKRLDICLKAADCLVGLGSGLTPSGDDFLGGMLFTLHVLGKAYPGQFQDDPSLITSFMKTSETKTNQISFTLMRDMSRGYGPAPLHQFMNSLLSGQPHDVIMESALELVKIGNSTGWDILTGVFAGLKRGHLPIEQIQRPKVNDIPRKREEIHGY